jgi:hypothetical protein
MRVCCHCGMFTMRQFQIPVKHNKWPELSVSLVTTVRRVLRLGMEKEACRYGG